MFYVLIKLLIEYQKLMVVHQLNMVMVEDPKEEYEIKTRREMRR